MGGGGSAGKVGFPSYLEEQHSDFINGGAGSIVPTTSIYDLWETGLGVGGNPFTGLAYTDPDGDMTEVETLSMAFQNEVTGLSAADELSNAMIAATNAADNSANALATKAFEDNQKRTRARSIRAFSGQMAGINAVNSSAYMFGIALIESAALQSVENFRAELTLGQQQQLVQSYIQLRSEKMRLLQTAVTTLLEIKRIRIVAEGEYVGNESDLSYRHANWDWEVVGNTVAAMGGLGGGTRLPKGPSKAMSAIGGAAKGAAAGGSIGGPVGAGIGAVVGGAAGFFGA